MKLHPVQQKPGFHVATNRETKDTAIFHTRGDGATTIVATLHAETTEDRNSRVMLAHCMVEGIEAAIARGDIGIESDERTQSVLM